jgi:RimJ/RimL family protein N-acetyltransferase
MSIDIVPVTESHIPSFHACLDAVCREGKYLTEVEAMPLERFRAVIRHVLANDVTQLVALEGSTVIGWCDIVPGRSYAIKHRGTLGMGVAATHRRRGVGTRLLTVCLARAREKGISRVELEARADNIRAIGLYEKEGFVHEASKRNAFCYDGVYYDAVQMSKWNAAL